MNRYTVHEMDDGSFAVWDTELLCSVTRVDRSGAIRIADALNNDPGVRSCGSLADHEPHLNEEFTCPGMGPFMSMSLSRKETRVFLSPPCICTDSIRSVVGTCPPRGDKEFGFCPVRCGLKEYE